MGGLLAYVSLQVTTALKRHAIVYGLMALGFLMIVFAAGYGLDAVRTWLMFRDDGVLASLIVAGGLIAMAGCLVGVAMVLKGRPKPSSATRSTPPSRARPYSKSYSPASLAAAGAAAAGALTAAVIIARSRSLREILARHPRP